jgi:hypothetical protein
VNYNYIEAITLGYTHVQVVCYGDPYVYENIEPISGSMPLQVELDEWIIAETKSDIWIAIKSIRDTYSSTGVMISTGVWFQSDSLSRIQYLAMMILGDSLSHNIKWKLIDNTFVTLTPALVREIFDALVAYDQTIFSHAEFLKAQMLLLSGSDVNSFQLDTGWPQTYLEWKTLQV